MKNMNNVKQKNWLEGIILKETNKDVPFFELDRWEQTKVLKVLSHVGFHARFFKKKWFDLLTNKFYTHEIKLDETSHEHAVDDIETFDTFDNFYEHVEGQIYTNSCYYGYSFSNEEIKKYSIDLEKVNMKSLIDYDIDSFSFESLLKKRSEEDALNANIALPMIKKIEKCESIRTISQLEKKYNSFMKSFNFYDAKYIFFSVLIRKYKTSIKQAVVEFASRNDEYKGLRFADILLNYGRESAVQMIDKFGGMWSKSTVNRYKAAFRRILSWYENKKYKTIRKIYFDRRLQLYCVEENYCHTANDVISKKDYFYTFDEFANYIGEDLSSANLLNAPIDRQLILKCKTDKNTVFPRPKKYSAHLIEKNYVDGEFVVKQQWLDDEKTVILSQVNRFNHFFNFVSFLKGDISGSNLLLCEGVENIRKVEGLNYRDIKVRSDIAEKLGLQASLIPNGKYAIREFVVPEKNEVDTIKTFELDCHGEDDKNVKISYITDIHLLHRFESHKCKTEEDVEYVIETIARDIGENATGVNLIGGDTSSDFEIFKRFIAAISRYRKKGYFFFTLGNHELWGLNDRCLEEIVNSYKNVIAEHENMFLVHNNVFYYDNGWKEIDEETLSSISEDELRIITRAARIVLFGGVGFAGMNKDFNANNGIYMHVLDRDSEIQESLKFKALYEKVTESLKGKNIVVLTHMPMSDWGGTAFRAKNGVVYINGHSHKNYFYDDGITRIYSDNQIGYRGTKVSLKTVGIDDLFDWFASYSDGIYEIERKDYEAFYRGLWEFIDFNREYEKLFMLKREHTYMFLMQAYNGSLFVLNGGSIRKAGNHQLNYFYDYLSKYSSSIVMFLSKYDSFQKRVSNEIKKIGGDGTIHGCIVDIDFFNHLYINPLDGSITPYSADSMIDKWIYPNIPSLLKFECPKIYEKYQKELETVANNESLTIYDRNQMVIKKKIYEDSTEMYKISRILKGLQFTTKYNIVRLWNDAIIADASEENGKLIVTGIINPDSMPKPIVDIKPKVRRIRESKPKVLKVVLSEEEKIKIRDDKYKEKIMSETNGKISCTAYRGSTEKADYHCNVCNHEWSTRPDHFKNRQNYGCPNCRKIAKMVPEK